MGLRQVCSLLRSPCWSWSEPLSTCAHARATAPCTLATNNRQTKKKNSEQNREEFLQKGLRIQGRCSEAWAGRNWEANLAAGCMLLIDSSVAKLVEVHRLWVPNVMRRNAMREEMRCNAKGSRYIDAGAGCTKHTLG